MQFLKHFNFHNWPFDSKKLRNFFSINDRCNSEKILDNMFYEADVAYIGARSKEPGHQGCGTEQQPFFIALSTSRNSNYPQFIK